MIRFIRRDEPGETLGIAAPVEIAAVHDASADLAGMAIHVFRRRVRHNIGAEAERTAENGRGEGVVDDQRNAVFVGDLGELRDIENAPGRICDGLAENAFRIRTERRLNRLRVGIRIDERELNAELLERNGKEVESSAVEPTVSFSFCMLYFDFFNK